MTETMLVEWTVEPCGNCGRITPLNSPVMYASGEYCPECAPRVAASADRANRMRLMRMVDQAFTDPPASDTRSAPSATRE